MLSKDTPPDTENSSSKTVRFSESAIETTTTEREKPAPGPLISKELTPGPLLDSKTTEVQALIEPKKARARRLLEVLSSNDENV